MMKLAALGAVYAELQVQPDTKDMTYGPDLFGCLDFANRFDNTCTQTQDGSTVESLEERID